MDKSVLILGANGRFGRHAAEAFWNAGWHVTLFDRDRDDLAAAARGQAVIVAGWNPPYSGWAEQLLPLHARIQAAARTAGATVILPANVYVFAPDTPGPWGPGSPHDAVNPLGRIRVALEDSYRRSGVQTIVLRAGDFIDTEPSAGWLDKVILKDLARGFLTYPGVLNADHAWAYLPDLAVAAVALADRRTELGAFTDLGFEGYTMSAHELAGRLGDLRGHAVRARRMAWWPLTLARPFWPMARHLHEMRYLWDLPHRLDGARLGEYLPGLRPTPVEAALVRATAHLAEPRGPMPARPRQIPVSEA